MTKPIFIATAIAMSSFAAIALPSFSQDTFPALTDQARATAISNPSAFAEAAASSNTLQIESAKLALERATADEIKKFAEQIISDQSEAANNLSEASQAEAIVSGGSLLPHHREVLERLKSLQGQEFDAAFIEAQNVTHDEALSLFQGYHDNGPDGELRNFAGAMTSTLKMHQVHARALQR